MIYNIQSLRAVAAMLVVIAHLDAMFVSAGWQGGRVAFGTSGVDLFFTISGFVMVYTTARKPSRPWSFLLDRIIRIAPMYYLLTILVFLVALIAPRLLGSTTASLNELLKSIFFIPFKKSSGEIQPVLFLGWTLNYEMFFYTLFAIILTVNSTSKRIIILTISLITLVVFGIIINKNSTALFFYTRPVILEFASGAWIGLFYLRGYRISTPAASIFLILSIIVMVGWFSWWPNQERAVWSGTMSSIILLCALSLPQVNIKFVQSIGSASYSLYLIHPFLIIPMTKIFLSLEILDSTANILLCSFFAVSISCIVSIAIHRLVEKPLTEFIKLKFGKSTIHPTYNN